MDVDDSYEVHEARADEETDIVSFIQQNYFPRAIINKMYLNKNKHRIDNVEKKKIDDDIKSWYTIVVANVPCLIAIHKETNKIVGSTVMLVEENLKFVYVKNTDKNCTAKISPITEMPLPFQSELLTEIEKYLLKPALNPAHLFAHFASLPTAMKFTFLSVHPEHCHHNLATRLIQEAVKYAESRGIGFVYALCSSPFSRKATEINGFQKISDVDITKYRDDDGNLIFDGEEPYIVSWMAKQIQMIN